MTDPRAVEVRHPIGGDGSLDLRNVSGRVRLAGTDGDEAIVLVRSERGDAPQLNVERGNGSLLVEPKRDRGGLFGLTFDRSGGLDFDVRLPRGARLDVKTVSADIDGHDLAGEQHYKTVSADLRLTGTAGRISFVTVSGDVRIHDAGAVELDGATTSGDVTVEAQAISRLGLRTVSGDVGLKASLEAGPRHAVETVSGDLVMEVDGGVSLDSRRALNIGRERGPEVFGDGAARVSFRSMSGEYRVALRGDRRARPASTTDDQPDAAQPADESDRMQILRALERGEIDVDEATRRLEESRHA
jgi:hypothetical protein